MRIIQDEKCPVESDRIRWYQIVSNCSALIFELKFRSRRWDGRVVDLKLSTNFVTQTFWTDHISKHHISKHFELIIYHISIYYISIIYLIIKIYENVWKKGRRVNFGLNIPNKSILCAQNALFRSVFPFLNIFLKVVS